MEEKTGLPYASKARAQWNGVVRSYTPEVRKTLLDGVMGSSRPSAPW